MNVGMYVFTYSCLFIWWVPVNNSSTIYCQYTVSICSVCSRISCQIEARNRGKEQREETVQESYMASEVYGNFNLIPSMRTLGRN